jgi:hypothetical protein
MGVRISQHLNNNQAHFHNRCWVTRSGAKRAVVNPFVFSHPRHKRYAYSIKPKPTQCPAKTMLEASCLTRKRVSRY